MIKVLQRVMDILMQQLCAKKKKKKRKTVHAISGKDFIFNKCKRCNVMIKKKKGHLRDELRSTKADVVQETVRDSESKFTAPYL